MPAEEAASAFMWAAGPNQLRSGGAACLLGAHRGRGAFRGCQMLGQ